MTREGYRKTTIVEQVTAATFTEGYTRKQAESPYKYVCVNKYINPIKYSEVSNMFDN